MKTSVGVLAVFLAAIVVLSGCVGEETSDDGCADDSCQVTAGEKNFRLLISDEEAAIGDFDSVLVTIKEAEVQMKDASESSVLEKILINKEVDLVKLQGEISYSLTDIGLTAGEYSWIKLNVEKISAMKDGAAVEIKLPGDELKIMKSFTITAEELTTFVFDISVVAKGNGEYNLKPVISESGVVGKDITSDKVKECDKDGQNCKASEEKPAEEDKDEKECSGLADNKFGECCDMFYNESKESCAGEWFQLKGECLWTCNGEED